MRKIQIAVISLFICTQAYAGAESHGGQVVVCPGQETVMLDYYQATLPTADGGSPALVDLSQMNSQDVIDLVYSRIPNPGPLVGALKSAQELIGPIGTWLQGSLQSISDSDPAYTLPPNCTLQQVAIRQDTTMYIDPNVLKLLSPAQQGILIAHEALYYIAAEQNGLSSSVEVRMVLRNLLAKNLDMIAFSKSVHEMGSKLFWWEDYTQRTYYSSKNINTEFQFLYDPMTGGDQPTYLASLSLSPNISECIETGNILCDNDGTLECHTTSGSKKCVLKNIQSFSENSQTAEGFQLTCSDDGADLWLETDRPNPTPAPSPAN